MNINKKYIYLLSFFIPFCVMVSCLIYFRVQPFGDHSLMIVDGLHQYMPFFSILYDKLRTGESLFYSFRAGLGINFWSLFAYYLSSPLNLFIVFFKKTQLNMAVSFLLVLKVSLSGLTAGIYFSSKTEKAGITALAASMTYALNSYVVGYSWNVMWMDVIMIFPLVILGIERLIDKKDGRLYCLALFYALFCNYYIAFMVCAFSVIWYLCCSFRSVKQFIARGLAFTFYSFLAAGMAAVLLVPAYLGIRQTMSGGEPELPAHGWESGFADLLARQFNLVSPVSHDNFDGNVNLYLGMFVVLTAVLYLLNKEIKLADKIKRMILIILFYVSFSEKILNFIWHGFHDQYGIPNRFSFLLGFVFITMFFDVFEHRESIRNWQVVAGCILGVGMIYFARRYAEHPPADGVCGAAGMLLVFYAMILYLMNIDRRRRKWYVSLFGIAAMAEIAVTAVMGFGYIGQISISKFYSGTEDMEQAVKSLSDGAFYRSELAGAKMVDENVWYGLNGVGIFGSTVKGSTVNIMDSLGFYTAINEYLYKGAVPLTNLMFGVKYIYYRQEDQMKTDFQYKETYGDFDVYENPAPKLSLGYIVSDSVMDWNYDSAYPFRVLNDFCFTGYDVDEVFRPIEIPDPKTAGCTAKRTNDGEFYFEYQEADPNNIVFVFPVTETIEQLYMFYDGTQVEQAWVDVGQDNIINGDIDSEAFLVGRVEAGSVVTVRFRLKGETESGYIRLSAADLRPDRYNEALESMTRGAFGISEMDSRHIEGNVVSGENEMLFLSIPYDEGWRAEVDGKRSEITKIGDAFLAVPLSKGDHHISLTYTPEGFFAGRRITAVCVCIFAGMCIAPYFWRKTRRPQGCETVKTKKENYMSVR